MVRSTCSTLGYVSARAARAPAECYISVRSAVVQLCFLAASVRSFL